MLTVMVADPHVGMGDALAELVGRNPGVAVVARAFDRAGTARLLARHRPDVLLLDPVALGRNWPAALQLVQQASPETGIVLIGMEDSGAWKPQVARSCAVGYVSKRAPRPAWGDAINAAVAAGVAQAP
jgi:DNA-binding NarL/FixJ family response regulator